MENFLIGVSFVFMFVLGIVIGNAGPSAIDVYRGKTSLQITYDHGRIDSVVVYKKDLKDSIIIK